MIDPAQIPDEVVEAAAKAIGEETYETLRDAARAAIAAALAAWPHAEIDSQYDVDFLILPLTQEPRT
jgi:hypothetical protein